MRSRLGTDAGHEDYEALLFALPLLFLFFICSNIIAFSGVIHHEAQSRASWREGGILFYFQATEWMSFRRVIQCMKKRMG